MVAVDTNVLIRLLTGDHPKQAEEARALFATEEIWVAKTVLLETDWVLRSLYEFDEKAIRDALAALLGLSNVRAEDESTVVRALAMSAKGIDFADAFHCCSTPENASFASFDKTFVRKAKRAGERMVRFVGAKS